ncbi:MAG: DNA sulfur modification protein DndD, partial [Clostridium sp.]
MIINNIKMKNFRSYEDETEFSFSPSGKQNIVLIGGENGAGKSTLFEAIKLCIYGPTSYGYLGSNSNYLTKIKNNINNNAFKNQVVDCIISISLSFTEGTKVNEYTLKRKWEYVNQKINEDFTVYKNGNLLNDDEVAYFNKFLQSELPPSLFDFFFFDGEELSEFFIGKNSSSSLKEAVLQLFNYDTFNILKKQLLSFQRSIAKQNSNFSTLQEDYDNALSKVKYIKNEIEILDEEILKSVELLDTLTTQKNIMEDDFRNSGGILEAEKIAINSEINKLETERASINQYIKDFCNDTLPFLMISNLLLDTKNQIEKEGNVSSYKSISAKLSGDVIEKSLKGLNLNISDSSTFDKVAESILNNMFNVSELNNINEILMLSPDQQSSILSLITSIINNSDTHSEKIKGSFERLRKISESVRQLKDRLNSTISSDLVETYLREVEDLNIKIRNCETKITTEKLMKENNLEALRSAEYQYTRVKNQYLSSMQDNNVLDLSSNLTDYLDKLLSTLTKDKLKLIEDNFIDIFSTVIRKSDYVSSIVIEDSFDSTLYISKSYSKMEI